MSTQAVGEGKGRNEGGANEGNLSTYEEGLKGKRADGYLRVNGDKAESRTKKRRVKVRPDVASGDASGKLASRQHPFAPYQVRQATTLLLEVRG